MTAADYYMWESRLTMELAPLEYASNPKSYIDVDPFVADKLVIGTFDKGEMHAMKVILSRLTMLKRTKMRVRRR